jgi:hypothetical protein
VQTIYSTEVELIPWTIGSASGLPSSRTQTNVVDPGLWTAWSKLHQSRCRRNTHIMVCLSIMEHLGEWCAGYSLFSAQDLSSHMAKPKGNNEQLTMPTGNKGSENLTRKPTKTSPPLTHSKMAAGAVPPYCEH